MSLLSPLLALTLATAGLAPPADTLHLARLQARAVETDPRAAQAALQERASGLREQNLGADRLPRLLLRGDAAYQSETVEFPVSGVGIAPPPKERYEAAFEADWTVWDGGLVTARRRAEDARLETTLASLEADLYNLRMQVSDAFFAALLQQEQISETRVLHSDLEARLGELRERVAAGVALPGDAAALEAELLRVEQQADALEAERSATLAVLSSLTGQEIGGAAVLVLPELDAAVSRAREAVAASQGAGVPRLQEDLRAHPRFRALDAQRESQAEQVEVVRASRRPTLSAFGQLAYGSPGYRQFTTDLHEYWRAGVQVRWSPWEWGRADREVEQLRVEQRLVDTREEAFTEQLLRALEVPLRRMEHLESALSTDDRIIALREEVEAQARARLAERVISASAYTDARSDVQEARIARIRHEIERVRAQASYLVTLGLELS